MPDTAPDPVARSSASTVGSLFASNARLRPQRVAVRQTGTDDVTYAHLDERSRRLAGALLERGVGRGDRVAVLSENRVEYLEVLLAAARIGAVVACQNWRLAPTELAACLQLVEPRETVVSPRFVEQLEAATGTAQDAVVFGPDYEQMLASAAATEDDLDVVQPEDPLLILYTSGTTGLPKGAVISHRAEVVRNLVTRAEFGLAADDTFAAWTPLYHMGGVDNALGTLMSGGKVVLVDGYHPDVLADVVVTEPLGWLLLMPGMVGGFGTVLRERQVSAAGVKVCGVMADLVSPHEIAAVTSLLDAPYANTFGSTETGCPPCSSSLIPVGVAPTALPKEQSPFCEVRLVDEAGRDVPDGTPGELWMRGPTLFSGYWRDQATNERDFRGGWFHMGDLFVRNADATLDFVGRAKYLIKSGGENIYPAEIERVLLDEPRVADVAVVRRPDSTWGEVPVAFVVRRDGSLTEEDVEAVCRRALASYKRPKEVRFVPAEAMPRNSSGKVLRHELERMLTDEPAARGS